MAQSDQNPIPANDVTSDGSDGKKTEHSTEKDPTIRTETGLATGADTDTLTAGADETNHVPPVEVTSSKELTAGTLESTEHASGIDPGTTSEELIADQEKEKIASAIDNTWRIEAPIIGPATGVDNTIKEAAEFVGQQVAFATGDTQLAQIAMTDAENDFKTAPKETVIATILDPEGGDKDNSLADLVKDKTLFACHAMQDTGFNTFNGDSVTPTAGGAGDTSPELSSGSVA